MGVEDLDSLDDCISEEFFEMMVERSKKNTQIYYDIYRAEPSDNQRTFEELVADREAFENTSIEERQNTYDENIGGVVGHVVDFPVHYMQEQSLELDLTDVHNFVPKINFT